MNWQEVVVGLVVCFAVVSLYRHIQGIVSDARPGSGARPPCRKCGGAEARQPRADEVIGRDVLHPPLAR